MAAAAEARPTEYLLGIQQTSVRVPLLL